MAARKTEALPNFGRQARPDRHRTTCKLCPYQVLTGEPAVWLSKPAGLSHAKCAEREGLL